MWTVAGSTERRDIARRTKACVSPPVHCWRTLDGARSVREKARMAAHIHSIATEVPSNVVDEAVVREHLVEWLGPDEQLHGVVLDLLHGTRVKSRRFAFTPRELLEDRGLEWMNAEYAKRILELSERAVSRALAAAGIE